MVEAEEKRIVSEIHDLVRDATIQENVYREAVLNKEFIIGNQWIALDDRNQIVNIEFDETYKRAHRRYRPREVANIIFPIWRTYMAYMLKTRPRITAVPENAEEVFDIMGARAAAKIMEYLYEVIIVRKKAEKIFNYMLVYGSAILHPYYDPYRKTCNIKIIPPTQIFPYPEGVCDWDEVTGIVWEQSVPTKNLKRNYPDEDLTSEEKKQYLEPVSFSTKPKLETTNFYHYWMLPSKDEKGFMVRMANDKFVEVIEEFPYDNKDAMGLNRLPFIEVHDNIMPDELFGFSTLGLVRQRQRTHNQNKSLITELLRLKPKWLVDVNSKIRLNELIDEDSTIHEYVGQAGAAIQPNWSSPPMTSPQLAAEVATTPQEVEHTSGFHGVTLRGETIGSVQSGIGIRSLQEKDELRLIPALESFRLGLVETFDQLYCLVRQYYEKSQIDAILGEMGELDILAMASIKEMPMKFRIQETTFSPFSAVARQQMITQVLQTGIFPIQDPRTRRKIMDYIDPAMAEDFDMTTNEERRARAENVRLLKLETVQIMNDDDDAVHIEALNLVIKDIRFIKLDMRIQRGFLAHKQQHLDQGMAKFMRAQQMAQAAQQSPAAQSEQGMQRQKTPQPVEPETPIRTGRQVETMGGI